MIDLGSIGGSFHHRGADLNWEIRRRSPSSFSPFSPALHTRVHSMNEKNLLYNAFQSSWERHPGQVSDIAPSNRPRWHSLGQIVTEHLPSSHYRRGTGIITATMMTADLCQQKSDECVGARLSVVEKGWGGWEVRGRAADVSIYVAWPALELLIDHWVEGEPGQIHLWIVMMIERNQTCVLLSVELQMQGLSHAVNKEGFLRNVCCASYVSSQS